MASEGNKKAERTLKIIDEYDSLLSTILIGNTIVNVGASSVATLLFVAAMGSAGASVSTLVMTFVILIIGEITPKSLAKEFPESYAMAVSGPMNLLLKLFTPLSFIFAQWKKLLSKLFKVKEEPGVTEGEFLTMVEEAESAGGISEEDSDLIYNVLHFNDQEVDKILTPRIDVIAASLNSSPKEVDALFREWEYTRLPVYEENIDDIVGFIHLKDFTDHVMTGESELKEIIQPIPYVSPNMKISKLLQLLQQKHIHIAVVTDEFGGTDGIVTMEDILEELVGEIYDEHDEVEKYIVKTGKDEYLVQCNAELEDMFEYFDKEEPESGSVTVAGWVTEQFGDIPEPNEQFTYENLLITVKSVESRRVSEIRVKVLQDEDSSDTEE